LAVAVAIVGGLAATTGIGELEIFAPGSGTTEQRLSAVEGFLADNSSAIKTELQRMQGEIDALELTPTPEPVPSAVTVKELVTAWENNSIAADRKYKGRTINIEGYLESIDTVFGVTTVSLGTGELFSLWTVVCTMKDGYRDELSKLNQGDRVIVRGRVTGELLLSIGAEDCVLPASSKVTSDATAAATPTSSPSPTPTPEIDLATTTQAHAWISITQGDYDRLDVQFLVFPDSVVIDVFDLEVSLFAGRTNLGTFCNASRIFGGEWSSSLSCESVESLHGEVTRATVSIGDTDLRCERNTVESTSDETLLACEVRR